MAVVSVNDTELLSSGEITANIFVGDRNDGPLVDLGAGGGMDLNITFTENGASIPIVLPHIVSIVDEEGHNISRLTAELLSPNGNLDPSDAIFLRTPMPFIDNFHIHVLSNTTRIDISLNATTATYTNALLSIYYDNNELEPTLFNGSNSTLLREVLITIYDANFLLSGQENTPGSNFDDNFGVSRTSIRVGIVIHPVNDNPPRIVIRAEPGGCGLSSSAGAEGATRRRRDIRAASSRIRKRTLRDEGSEVRVHN